MVKFVNKHLFFWRVTIIARLFVDCKRKTVKILPFCLFSLPLVRYLPISYNDSTGGINNEKDNIYYINRCVDF